MASKFNIKIIGLKTANKYLNSRPPIIKRDIGEAMSKISLFMEGEVKESIAGHKAEPTSVDTGQFLSSVASTNNETSATITSNATYSGYLEHGTSKLPARHHFMNSLTRNKPKIRNYIQKEIKTSL